MNNARAEFASDGGELAKMMQQRVDQRAAIAGVIGRARAGVDHHARGLVDYREIVVFVDNFQRNFFRYRAQRTGLRLAEKGDAFAAAQAQDRKSTRLNSSHQIISYAVFCLKKKQRKSYQSRTL